MTSDERMAVYRITIERIQEPQMPPEPGRASNATPNHPLRILNMSTGQVIQEGYMHENFKRISVDVRGNEITVDIGYTGRGR